MVEPSVPSFSYHIVYK